MTDTELLEHLSQYIGYRVRITSDIVHQQWTELKDVRLLSSGVWCYGNDGLGWLVGSGGLEVEVEPINGGYDDKALAVRMEAVANAVEAYGSTPAEQRQWCHCNGCQPKHDKEEAEQLQRLQQLTGNGVESVEDKKVDTDTKGYKGMFEGF